MSKYEIIFIRFGDLPLNDKSKNYLTNEFENGVSVYEGIIKNDEAYVIIPTANYCPCVSLTGVLDRPVYQVEGNIIGYGSDGEPLLDKPKIIRTLKLHK